MHSRTFPLKTSCCTCLITAPEDLKRVLEPCAELLQVSGCRVKGLRFRDITPISAWKMIWQLGLYRDLEASNTIRVEVLGIWSHKPPEKFTWTSLVDHSLPVEVCRQPLLPLPKMNLLGWCRGFLPDAFQS